MSEKNKEMLSSLMKKQISEKSSKKTSELVAAPNAKKTQEELETEELEEAKKVSKGKAADYDQSEMIKKLILESGLKYTLLILILIIFTIGLIKFGPAIIAFFNGLLYKIIMAALNAK
jgi:hypothetical protein